MGAQNHEEDVLMVTSCMPRYLYKLRYFNNCQMSDYINWYWRFVSALSPKIQAKMRVRTFIEDYGWDIADRWKDRYPEIPIEGWDVSFLKSLEKCRVFVCDHLATVYAEGMAVNKPTILFWDPQIFKIRNSAIPFFDDLRSAGILHDTPECAAFAVNSAYDDVINWWNDPVKQAARSKFCKRFSRTSPKAVAEWDRQLRQMLK